ncbi:PAS domain S-box protein [Planctomicrobium sp. SH661]|uniref:PAS domain S-box protein n=1 Tax=Planctomicrobium sp. SH661 TaxID=3448124 RepID=UPI003F5B6D8A
MSREFDRGVLIGVGLLVALVIANATISFLNARSVYRDSSSISHTQDVIARLDAIRADLHKLEAQQHLFVISGDEELPKAIDRLHSGLHSQIEAIRTLTADNPAQQQRITKIHQSQENAIREMTRVVQVRQTQGVESATRLIINGGSRRLLEEIHHELEEMQTVERELLIQKRADTAQAYSTAIFFGWTVAACCLAAIVLFLLLLYRSSRAQAQAAEAVSLQHEWFRTTLNSIGDAVIVTDTDGNATFLNPIAEQLTGWTTAAAQNHPLLDVFHIVNESTRKPVENPAVRALNEGVIVGLANHTILIARDGTERPIDDSAAPIRNEQGKITGAVLVFRDMSERKRNEAELQHLAESLRLALDSADLGAWDWDPATDQMKISSRAGKIYGIDSSKTYKRESLRSLIHPEDRERARIHARQAVEDKCDYNVEYRIARPDGGELWVAVRGRGVYDDAGKMIRMLGIVQDVTARKESEEKLLKSSERNQFLAKLANATQSLADAERVMEISAQLLAEHLHADRCAYAEVENETDFNITGDYSTGGPGIAGRWPIVAFGPELAKSVFENRPFIVDDVSNDPRIPAEYRSAYESLSTQAVIGVPLHKDGRLTAAMAVHQSTPRKWTAEEVDLVTTVVARCWEALVRVRGIQEERRLHAKIAAERGRLEEVFRLAPSFMAVLRGPDHVFERVNERYQELVGSRDLIGLKLRDAIPEVASQGYLDLLNEVYQTGKPYVGIDVNVQLQGTKPGTVDERTLEFVYQPIFEGDGSVSGILVQGIDLTRRKRAEASLIQLTAESERLRRLYETALSNTPDFVYVFDLEHRFTYANEALLRMYGKTAEEAIGRTFLELGYEPWHAEMHEREIDEVRATRRPIRGEVPFNGTYGRRVYDYIFAPVFGADGEVEAVTGVTRDVTDRQAMEQELRESDRRKDEFIALLAHELRNPLAPIRTGIDLLRMSANEPELIDEVIGTMEEQTHQLVRLVDDLLDISRITSGKVTLRKKQMDLAKSVQSAQHATRALFQEFGHELTVEMPPEPIWLDADATRLAQVLSNLLTNAARYTENGGSIHLTCRKVGEEAIISVKDTGIGIAPEMLSKIFEMFTQAERSLDRSYNGLGIGLTLVKRLVEMHGGTVTAHSDGLGQGSEFVVRLPTIEPAAPTDDGSIEPANHLLPPLRVLVVDDNLDAARLLSLSIQRMGHDTRTAEDGLAALQTADEFRPQVIFMDLGMPRMNGYEAARKLRESDFGKEVILVALTGWGQEDDKRRTREAGFNDHFVKPIELASLIQLLATYQAKLGRANHSLNSNGNPDSADHSKQKNSTP